MADFVMLTDCDEPSCYQEVMRRHDKRVGEDHAFRDGFSYKKQNMGFDETIN